MWERGASLSRACVLRSHAVLMAAVPRTRVIGVQQGGEGAVECTGGGGHAYANALLGTRGPSRPGNHK